MLRLEVDVGSEVDITLIKLCLDLYEGCTLSVELALTVVDKAVTYLLHGIFAQR